MMIIINASIFAAVNMSWTLVAHFTFMQFMNVKMAENIGRQCKDQQELLLTIPQTRKKEVLQTA